MSLSALFFQKISTIESKEIQPRFSVQFPYEQIMSRDLKSKTARSRLLPRREPYWHRLSAGFHIGYRVLAVGNGTWIARRRGPDKKKRYSALGTFEDFDDAVKAAYARAGQGIIGVKGKATVEDACRHYIANLKVKNGARAAEDAEGRFRRLVYGKDIGITRLDQLTQIVVRNWLNAQVAGPDEGDEDSDEIIRRSKASANRNLRTFKAALNLAKGDKLVASDEAWVNVAQFGDVYRSREVTLSAKQQRDLLSKCSSHFKPFAQALLHTAARPGELAAVKVGDFDQRHGTLALSSGKTGRRVITLSTAAAKFFVLHTKQRDRTEKMFLDEWGHAWNKDSWKEQFRESAVAAELPADYVLYSLRHTRISEMLIGGMSTVLVALLAGTSVEMLEKHYAHILQRQTRKVLDGLKAT